MKYGVIQGHRGAYPIDLMCKMLGVSKSGFYDWKRLQIKGPSPKKKRRVALERAIRVIHLGSEENYGSQKVQYATADLGFTESPRTIARLMRRGHLRSRVKKKFRVTTDSNHKLKVAPNHLMQDFKAYAPNQIWMSDLTYIRTRQGWLYVCAIIDLYSRKIVGWAASQSMTADLVILAYLRAVRSRRPGRGLIFHSDRGSQYASAAFKRHLAANRHVQSMSRRANCWDSAPIESFWHLLKVEHVYWRCYKTRDEATQSIRGWIDGYNSHRRHSKIGGISPDAFERKVVAKLDKKV